MSASPSSATPAARAEKGPADRRKYRKVVVGHALTGGTWNSPMREP